MTNHRASCQCGSLTAEMDGDPDFVIVCNCVACQRRTGAPFGTGAYFQKVKFAVSGGSKSWHRTAESRRALENFFCPDCGTTVYWTLEMRPDYVGVAYGAVETKLPDPVRVIWTDKQHDWVNFPKALPHFPKGTPE